MSTENSNNEGELHSSAGASGQAQYVTVPISIYAVQGSEVTPEDVEAFLKKLNEIYNCEVVVYIWNGQIIWIPDPNPAGTPGDITYPEGGNTAEHDNLSSTVANHPMNRQNPGIQVVFCNNIVNSSGQSAVGGYAFTGQNPAVVSDGGHTDRAWGGRAVAHEIGHVLGLDHNGNNATRPNNNAVVRYDSNGDGTVNASDEMGSDANGDGWVTTADQSNNMYGGPLTGDDLTDIQRQVAFNAARQYPGAVVRNTPPTGVPVPPNKPVQITPSSFVKPMNFTSGLITSGAREVDLLGFHLERDFNLTNPTVNITIILNGTIMTKDLFYTYGFVVNDTLPPERAIMFNYSNGAFNFFEEFPYGSGIWIGPIPMIPPEISFSDTIVTGDANWTEGINQTDLDSIVNNTASIPNSTMTIRMVGLELLDFFGNETEALRDVTVFSFKESPLEWIADAIAAIGVDLGPPQPFPYIMTDIHYGHPGQVINVSLYNFGLSQPVNITLDGEEVLVALTNGTGYFNGTFLLPSKPSGIYILQANDSDGNIDAMYIIIHIQNGGGPPGFIPGFDFIFIGLGLCCLVFFYLRKKRKLTPI